jgi:hypothetical protein
VRKQRITAISTLLATCFLVAPDAPAQDSHYWTQEYGSRAELLGGVVTGSLVDLGAAYYNPGTLALVEDADNVITSLTFQVENLTYSRTDTPENLLSTTSLRSAPSLFAGQLPWRLERGRLAYSFLVRQEFKTTIKYRYSETGEILPEIPGEELLVGETYNSQDMSEYWFGLTWSRRLGERAGFGISQFLTYFGQSTRLQNLVQVVSDNGQGGGLTLIDDFDLWTLGILWKVGLGFDFSPWTCGVSVTTPKLSFFGTGKALYMRSLIGVDVDNDSLPDSQIYGDLQEDLGSRHHSPLSIAVGGSYRRGDAAIHFSGEWFNQVHRYVALDADLEGAIGGQPLNRLITQEARDVFNAGIGVEYRFSERWTYYGAFRTDFSAAVDGSDARMSVTRWNLYHISSGMRFSVGSLGATLGASFAFGGDTIPERIDFTTADGSNLLLGQPGSIEADYLRLRFIVGFSF